MLIIGPITLRQYLQRLSAATRHSDICADDKYLIGLEKRSAHPRRAPPHEEAAPIGILRRYKLAVGSPFSPVIPCTFSAIGGWAPSATNKLKISLSLYCTDIMYIARSLLIIFSFCALAVSASTDSELPPVDCGELEPDEPLGEQPISR